MILERDVERALIRAVRRAGGVCLKFTSPTDCVFFPEVGYFLRK